jgi:hypothetical protein
MSQSNPLLTHEPNQLAETRKRYQGFDWVKRNFRWSRRRCRDRGGHRRIDGCTGRLRYPKGREVSGRPEGRTTL